MPIARYVRHAGAWVNLSTGGQVGGGGSGGGGSAGWGPQIDPGILATPTNVGYRGDPGILKELTPGSPLPSSLGASRWDGTAIIVNGETTPRSLEGYHVTGCIVSSVPITVKHCVVEPQIGDLFGITGSGTSSVVRVEDTTIIGSGDPAIGPSSNTQVNGISSDGRLYAVRCYMRGTSDGIHAVYHGSDEASGFLISQCWIQNTFLDDEQHCDGLQFYNPLTIGYGTVEYTAISPGVYSPTGQALNASLTSEAPTGPANATLIVVGNSFPAGAFHFRAGDGLHLRALNNNLGFVDTAHGEFGLVSVTADVIEWTGNVDGNGNPVSPN